MITHHAILGVATILYLALFFLYILYFSVGKKGILTVAWYCLLATFAVQTAGIGLRWVESYRLGIGHAPLSNFYESLIVFSWSISLLVMIMRKRLYPVITFAAGAASLGLMAYASLFPGVERGIQPLIPALQSNWLHVHVITCFLAYAAFLVSFVAGGALFPPVPMDRAGRPHPGGYQLQEHYYWLFHAHIWYTNGSRMGPLCMGVILELGPQGNVVAHNLDRLCPDPSPALRGGPEGKVNRSLVDHRFCECCHDLFRGQLFSNWIT